MKFIQIKDIVVKKDWIFLLKNSLPLNVVDSFSFTETMHIVYQLIEASYDLPHEEGFTAELMRDYAVNIMIILRARYSQEWKKDWKNEAFLGNMCNLVLREEEAFVYLKNAYEQVEDPPQSLILAFIHSGNNVNQFLSKKEIALLSRKAIEKGETYEAALRMAALAHQEKDQEQEKHWEKKAQDAEKRGWHVPIIIPNIMKDMLKDKRSQYEI